jgi:hypothetical protein
VLLSVRLGQDSCSHKANNLWSPISNIVTTTTMGTAGANVCKISFVVRVNGSSSIIMNIVTVSRWFFIQH